jgi:hypothetical protein
MKPLCLFLALFAFFTLSVTAAQAGQLDWCRPDAPAKIHIQPATENIVYDFSESFLTLSQRPKDPKNPYAENVHAITTGLMEGGWEATMEGQMAGKTHPGKNLSCLWFSDITITLKLAPTIYIANEFPKGTCMYDHVMTHELKHINVDRAMINKYAADLGKSLQAALRQKKVWGPTPSNNVERTKKQMSAYVNRIIKARLRALSVERTRRQRAVDTVKEYESAKGACPEQLQSFGMDTTAQDKQDELIRIRTQKK